MHFVPFDPAVHAGIVQSMTTQEILDISVTELPHFDRPVLLFMVYKDDGTLVGWVEAYNIDEQNNKCEVGIAFPAKSGLALVYPAAKRFQKMLFDEYKFHRLYARPLVVNNKSIKLLEWLGFTREGVEKEACKRKGNYVDLAIYGMTKTDYERMVV